MRTLYKYTFTEFISLVGAHLINWVFSPLAWYKVYVKYFKLLDPNFPSIFILSTIAKHLSQYCIIHSLPLFPQM